MSSDQLGNVYTIVSIIAGLGALGAYLSQAISRLRSNQEQSANKKAEELRKESEVIAYNVKRNADERATELKKATEDIAANIKREADDRDLKIRSYIDGLIATLTRKIDDTNIRVVSMSTALDALSRRSDLVNGNIANIRGDLADLSEDVADLQDRDEVPTAGTVRNAKTRKRAQRLRRRKIESDRIEQAENKY